MTVGTFYQDVSRFGRRAIYMVCYKNRKKKKYGLMCVYGGKGEVMTVGMPYAGYHRDIDDIFCGDKNDFKKVLSPF